MSAAPSKPRPSPKTGKARTAARKAADAEAPLARIRKAASKVGAGEGVKSVKGSYKIPKADYALFAVLKERAAATGAKPRKSELIRAGLHALMESGRVELRRVLDALPPTRK